MNRARIMKTIFQTLIMAAVIACILSAPVFPQSPDFQPPKGPMKWPPDWLEETGKRLERAKGVSQPGPEIELLNARASELLDKAKQSRDNPFRFGRFLNASNALLKAAEDLFWIRKLDHTAQEQDYWGSAFMLQGCYFRVRQADYFAEMSGDKNSEQYVTLARSLYQQARSAYDAREYQRAWLLGDASSVIVFALESIAQASVRIPDSHMFK
jgi:hypothetical protein